MSGEKSGKDMLLKLGENLTVAVAGTNTMVLAGHGLSAGDLVLLSRTEGTILSTRFYFVVDGTVDGTNVNPIDGTNFSIALVPDGTPVTHGTDGTLPITGYKTIGGLRTSTFSFKGAEIDVSNHGSNQWKNLKAGAGMRSVAIQGQGVYTNAANYRNLEVAALANALASLAFLDIDAGRIYSGSFKFAAFDATGKYDGEASFGMSCNSSGTVTIAQLGT